MPTLPIEIIEETIFHVTDVSTAFHLLVASRYLSLSAERALYHTIDLTVLRNSPIEHKVYRRFSDLLRHLLVCPRHASMVFYVLGPMIRYHVEVKTTPAGFQWPIELELPFGELPQMLSQLKHWSIPCDTRSLTFSTLNCPSKALSKLEMPSSGFYGVAWREDTADHSPSSPSSEIQRVTLFISGLQHLRFLRVIPQDSTFPLEHFLSDRRRSLLELPSHQTIEAIEGSFWLIRDVLPPTVLPRKLRFWDNHDLFMETVTVPPRFLDRLQCVRVLSCCGLSPKWSKGSSLPPLLAVVLQLPRLEILELRIPTGINKTSLLSLLSTFTKALLVGPAEVQRIVITLPKALSKQVKPIAHLVFSEIPSLKVAEIGAEGTRYSKARRGSEKCILSEVKHEDWWVYA
ncbi:hypothetical protein DL96DRAFT_998877 [Flagelloscypha sp. PMI_526]|nr:hypothetical protein DL96DRAFT_998877 [Flagelloscypha sp. PMI_526]